MLKALLVGLLIFEGILRLSAQDSLQVALQIGHQVVGSYDSAPKIYAVSNNDRWVVTSNTDEHSLIIWDILFGKIYATYPISFNIANAVFFANNEDVLVNNSLVFNIHTGKVVRKLPETLANGSGISINTSFSMQTNTLVYSAVAKNDQGKALEVQYKGYQKGFCTDSAYTRLWGVEHDRLFEYDLASGSVIQPIYPGIGQIEDISYDKGTRMVVVRGEQKTCFFSGDGTAELKYINQPLLNVTFDGKQRYLAGAINGQPGLQVWHIEGTPGLLPLNLTTPINYTAFFGCFIKGTNNLLIYNKNTQSGMFRLKVINLATKSVIWEDNQDANYTVSSKGAYIVAAYADGHLKIYDSHTFKSPGADIPNTAHEAVVSPDEQYVLQRERSASGGDRFALYSLPGLRPIYTDIKDSLDYPGSTSPYIGFLFSPDAKELFFYKGGSKVLGRFQIKENVMSAASLAQPVYDYGRFLLTEDGGYLLCLGGKELLVYDARSLQAISGKKMSKLISFNTPPAGKVFTIYGDGEQQNRVVVTNTADGATSAYPINSYLQVLNSDKSGSQFAYAAPVIINGQVIHHICVVTTDSEKITDSFDLPATEQDVYGQLIFSNDDHKLYIGWNNLYEYDLSTRNLRKLPVPEGGKFYPVNESDNGKFLFTCAPQNPADNAKLVVFDLASWKPVLQAPVLMYSYLLNSVDYPFMKGYPALFETVLNLKVCYVSVADSLPRVTGPANSFIRPVVLTHDGKRQLRVSIDGLSTFDSHNFRLLNAILPAQYGKISFTANKRYAVQYDNEIINVYDVQKGFEKVPFLYTTGKNGEYHFFDDRPLHINENLLLSAGGNYLATLDSYGEGAVNIYKFETGEQLYHYQAPCLLRSAQKESKDVYDPLGYLEMSGNERYVLFNTYEKFLIKADFRAKTEQRLAFPVYINAMAISNSGKWVAAIGGGDHPSLIVWDSVTVSKQMSLELNNYDIAQLKLTIYEQQHIVSVQKADGIYFYALNNLKLLRQFIDPRIVAESSDSTGSVRLTFGNNRSVSYSLPDFTVLRSAGIPGQYHFINDGPFQLILKDSVLVAKLLFDASNKEMMWFTPSNYYFVNKESRDAIAFRAHHDLYPTSVFDAVFNRPDTVFKILDPVFHFNKNLLDVYQAAYRTRAGTGNKSSNELANLDHLPAIKINSAVNDNNTHDKNFRVHINADGGHDIIKSYNVFVNGVPLFGKNGRPVVGPVLNQQVDIPLLPGKNAIEAIATNAAGLNSLPATLIEYLADSAGFKPHTYFIGVGISNYKNPDYDLNYAAKDIRDITAAMHHKNLDMVIDTFLDRSATRENVLRLREKLLHTLPEDRVIFYYCGHGVRKQDYFIGTFDFSFDDPAKDGINISEIYNLLDSIPARARFIMLDACNSGQYYGDQAVTLKGANGRLADPNVKVLPDNFQKARGARVNSSENAGSRAITVAEVMDNVFADFGNNYGIDVLAGTKGTEVAYETAGLKNGVFTHAMLQAVNTNLDGAYDHKPVPISSLKNYVSDLVSRLTGGAQKPVSRNENTDKDWVIW